MMVTIATKISNTLTPQEREVALNTSLHCPFAELSKLLTVLLAVKDCTTQCRTIEVTCNSRQILNSERCDNNTALRAIKRELESDVVDVVVLDPLSNKLTNY